MKVFDENTEEIPAYDKKNTQVFLVKATEVALDVLNTSDPVHPVKTKSLDLF